MPTYYQDGAVRVTGTAVQVGTTMLPIAELSLVWHARGRPTVRTASRRVARFGLIALLTVPVIGGAVVVATLLFAERGLAAQIGVAVGLVLLGLVLLVLLAPVIEIPMMALERSYDRGTAVREIWVRWRRPDGDHDLLLLRTTDTARFGRIYRAIQRAIEQADD
ncbi:MAG: DUF6232 family protein [Natronosporangium sp.]